MCHAALPWLFLFFEISSNHLATSRHLYSIYIREEEKTGGAHPELLYLCRLTTSGESVVGSGEGAAAAAAGGVGLRGCGARTMWEFGNASKNQGVRRRGVGLSASYRGAGESLASQAMRGAQGAGFDTSKNGGAGSLRSPAHANAVRGGSHRSTFSGSTAMHAGSVSGKMFGRSSNRYGRYSSAQRSGLDAVKITSSAWSDIAKVDDLLAYKSSFDRTCWCLKLGVLRRSNRQRPTESVTTNAWLNRWEDYCEVPLFLISLTIILMLASSLPPTIIYISLKVTAKYFGTRQHDQTRDIDGTDVHDALPLIEDEHEESNWMSTLLTLSVAGLAVLIVLLARLPWFTLRRAVFSRVVNLFRATVYPKALLASACTTIASIVLHYAFANAAGVGRGVPGGRGGTGDHLWGQMIYQCSLWEDDSYVLGFNGAQSSAPITHDICVNSAQLTSFITALMGGWIATAYFVWTEQYVLWFPVVHRPRIMQLFPRVAQSVYVAARLGAYSFLASILCVHVLPSRGLRLSVVEFVLVSLYGTANVEGAKGIIDTAHPGLAALWDQSTLASCMMCWGNSILVHFTMLAAHHILSVIITDAAFTHVSENLLQWSDLLVGASVRGRYRLAQRSSWDVDLLVDSKQSSLSVVRNELRRRQAIAMRHFGTNVDIHTILSVGNRPLPHAPALFNSDTVMAPLGAYGQEAESSSDDGIEALIMALAIARPGSIHEKFVTWVPRARRSVNVEKIQEPMHGQSSSSSCDQLSSCFSVLRWFCCFNCCCPCFCCGRPSSPSRSSSSVSRRPGSGPSILGSGGVSSNKTSSLGLPKLSHEYMSAGSTLQVGDSLSGARNDALNFKASAREYEGIRSTVPPKRVLQKVSERRFYDVLQNHAKIYGDSVFTLGLTEEERDQRYRYNTAYWRAERKLSLRDEISRASSILHLRSVANFDEKKLIRLINSNRGNHWVEVVRLCTAKIDALTLSLQIMSGSKIIVASPYGDEGNSMGGDNFGSLWSAIKSTTGAATNPEPLALGMHPGRVVGGYERMSTNTSRAYIWDRASRHRSRKLWRLWFWPRCLRGFRWWHFEFSEMMPVYAAARTREKLNSSYADLAVWALQEVNKQYDEHPWVNWPQDANSKLEEAYQTEMQQVEVSCQSIETAEFHLLHFLLL